MKHMATSIKEEINNFESLVKNWLIDNGYINNNWRFTVLSRNIIGKSDIAEICCQYYLPRKKKPSFISFNYNFVKDLIYIDTIQVNR
jgi:hypothetical protein